MGLFNGYLKEGPGVSKDAPQKTRFFLFFELFGRKFSKLIWLNLLYLICLVPLIFGICFSVTINPNILSNGVINGAALATEPLFQFSGDLIALGVLIISLFIAGPATAGFTYVIRNFQREEHAWVFSDFKDTFKDNFKQATLLAFIDLFIYFTLYIAFVFYRYSMPVIQPSMASVTPFFTAAIVVITVIYTWMHFYMHVMMITFKLKLSQIFRNAILFAIGKLPVNLLVSVICIATVLASLYYPLLGIICAILITLSFIGYVVVFSTYPTIDSYMIEPQSVQDDEEERTFNDNREE